MLKTKYEKMYIHKNLAKLGQNLPKFIVFGQNDINLVKKAYKKIII